MLNALWPILSGEEIWMKPDRLILKLICWSIVSIYALLCSYILYIRGKDKIDIQKSIYNSYSLYALGFALNRIIFMISDLEDWNNNFLFPEWLTDPTIRVPDSELYIQIVLIGYLFGIFSALFLIKTVEKKMNYESQPLSRIFMIILVFIIIIIIFSLIQPSILTDQFIRIFRLIVTIFASIGVVFYLTLHLKIFKDTSGSIRKTSFMVFFGILLIYMGGIIDGAFFNDFWWTIFSEDAPAWLSPIFPTIGLTLVLIYQKN